MTEGRGLSREQIPAHLHDATCTHNPCKCRFGPLPEVEGRTRSWWRRCRHDRVRCTHGDEIIARGWRRRVCMDCGRALKGDLPNPCTYTGKPHLSQFAPARDQS